MSKVAAILADAFFDYRQKLGAVVVTDIQNVLKKDVEYGGSWKRRGGANAFFMLARKWDRIEHLLGLNGSAGHHDIFRAIEEDRRVEGVLDDIRDLRRYLILIEAEMVGRGHVYLDDFDITITNLTQKRMTDGPATPAHQADKPVASTGGTTGLSATHRD